MEFRSLVASLPGKKGAIHTFERGRSASYSYPVLHSDVMRACERLRPMANPATDVEYIPHLIKGKPASGQFDVVRVPPIVAGVTEIFSRMRVECPKFVGHGIRTRKQSGIVRSHLKRD